MGTGIEAVGDAVTGGALSRAVEPAHGEGDHAGGAAGPAAHPGHGACLNCGAELIGLYCHRCGQSAHVHRTLGAFAHDLLHGVFHFEGKIWRTLPDLAIRPGRLTRDYIEGKRARYVSPLALFLFCVFLMFAVVGWTSSLPTSLPVRPDEARSAIAQADAAVSKLEGSVRRLQAQRASAPPDRAGALDAQIAKARAELDEARTGRAVVAAATGKDAKDTLQGIKIDTGRPWLDERIRDAAADPKFLIYKMKSSAYKFAWAIIPLSVPFVALLFVHRRRFSLYDHAVFVTYSLCAMSLLLVLGSLVGAAGAPTAWLLLLVPLHFFAQLRGAYALSAGSALWRTGFLLFIALGVMMLFAALLILLGIF